MNGAGMSWVVKTLKCAAQRDYKAKRGKYCTVLYTDHVKASLSPYICLSVITEKSPPILQNLYEFLTEPI